MGPRERGGFLRSFGFVVVTLIALGLAAVVGYLLSEINHRRYRLAAHEGQLVVERGRMLPFGFEPFVPASSDLRAAYAPVALPTGETFGHSEVFEDRADVDRALFAVLAGWVRERLQGSDPEGFTLATELVRRCELLPSLSEEQRAELRTLRADLAFRHGRQLLTDIAAQLGKALEEFKLALQLGTSRQGEARQWIDELERRILEYRELSRSRAAPLPGVPPEPSPVPAPKLDEPAAREPPAGESPSPREPPKWRL